MSAEHRTREEISHINRQVDLYRSSIGRKSPEEILVDLLSMGIPAKFYHFLYSEDSTHLLLETGRSSTSFSATRTDSSEDAPIRLIEPIGTAATPHFHPISVVRFALDYPIKHEDAVPRVLNSTLAKVSSLMLPVFVPPAELGSHLSQRAKEVGLAGIEVLTVDDRYLKNLREYFYRVENPRFFPK